MPDLDEAATQVRHVMRDPRTAADVLALAYAIDKVIALLREETYAPVVPMPTRIVVEPRVLPGETLGDYWARQGIAGTSEDRPHWIVPLTEDEEANP